MAKYKMWDKTSDIYTLGTDRNGKNHWTAEEYISEKAPWAANPNVKIIVGGGVVNGTVFMEYESTVASYKSMGAEILPSMTDNEVLAAMENFEYISQQPGYGVEQTIEYRTAIALESIAEKMDSSNSIDYDLPDKLVKALMEGANSIE